MRSERKLQREFFVYSRIIEIVPLKMVFEPLTPGLSLRRFFNLNIVLASNHWFFIQDLITMLRAFSYFWSREENNSTASDEGSLEGCISKHILLANQQPIKISTRKKREENQLLFGNLTKQQLLIAFSIDINFCAIVSR